MNFKVIITKDEDGFFVASAPTLPGCHSQGKSVEEATANIKEAIKGYLDVAKKHGDPRSQVNFQSSQLNKSNYSTS